MGKTHRGKRGGRRNRPACGGPVPSSYGAVNQAVGFYNLEYSQYLAWIVAIAQTRFVWSGLPDTCDERFLERALIMTGHASIAKVPETGVWMSLQAASMGDLNAYGNPVRWQCIGYNGKAFYEAGIDTGVYAYERRSRANLWGKLTLLARKLAKYARTESVNLSHQFTPFLITAPEEQVQSVSNVYAQLDEGQPAVVGYKGLGELVKDGIGAIDTKVEWKGDKLQSGALGVWGEVFRILGIPHLAFEKRERMITDEAQTTLVPTKLMLEDALNARLDACRELERFGLSVSVEVNPEITMLFEGAALADMAEGEVDENVVS